MNQGLKWGAGFAAALVVLGLLVHWHHASENRNVLGSVNTEFKLIGPDHKIIIESYDDPKIDGITVFISKSQTGGIKGALGLAEDTSDASVAVRQTGPIKVKEAFENGEEKLRIRSVDRPVHQRLAAEFDFGGGGGAVGNPTA
jgi:CreA protein